ncbi:MAG TPA: Mut7-C RNAse domain-containing protein [Smithella sp.]|nr:Mut7-C RNAse domain-containing protein [Smithella sp.]
MSESDLKFMTDNSLARLAKWLRLLGYDAVVFPHEAGRAMLRLAGQENRTVLSRRIDLAKRQFSGTLFLVKDLTLAGQLKAVLERFSLKIKSDRMFTRCLACNEKLEPASKDAVRELVPLYVLENRDRFNQCPRCHKIYWTGTHPQRALKFMKQHIPNHLP